MVKPSNNRVISALPTYTDFKLYRKAFVYLHRHGYTEGEDNHREKLQSLLEESYGDTPLPISVDDINFTNGELSSVASTHYIRHQQLGTAVSADEVWLSLRRERVGGAPLRHRNASNILRDRQFIASHRHNDETTRLIPSSSPYEIYRHTSTWTSLLDLANRFTEGSTAARLVNSVRKHKQRNGSASLDVAFLDHRTFTLRDGAVLRKRRLSEDLLSDPDDVVDDQPVVAKRQRVDEIEADRKHAEELRQCKEQMEQMKGQLEQLRQLVLQRPSVPTPVIPSDPPRPRPPSRQQYDEEIRATRQRLIHQLQELEKQ